MTPQFQNVLAIETSCDDTSVAIVNHRGEVLSVVSAHQNLAHEPFGGIVPEIACRNHTHNLIPLMEQALSDSGLDWGDIDGYAVTAMPGLVGSLLVGLVTVKTLALVHGKPFIGVNHLEGHLLAPFLSDKEYRPPTDFLYPYIALAISGGHTSLYRIDGLGEYIVLGHTIDDAAGEAFDKFAKMIGLGFPGGVQVDRHAKSGNVQAFQFPRAMIREEHYNFSFSGLKTAALRTIEPMSIDDKRRHLDDLCASYQEAIVDVLLARLARAVENEGLTRAVLTGGVSANSRLRARAQEWAQSRGVQLVVPPIRYCTDNAAMIGFAGIQRLNRGETSSQDMGPQPRAPLGRPATSTAPVRQAKRPAAKRGS